ncbi:MAG: TRAM domain-containing protein [PVC group bacterium]
MNAPVELKIEDVVYPGRGLARMDGYVVFIPGVLPGETVRARITRRRRTYAEAELIAVEIPSPRRVDPACPLAGLCPGCSYQHAEYGEELRIKEAQFINLLRRIGRVAEPPSVPPVPSPVSLGYRNRLTLHAARVATSSLDMDGGIRLGYVGFDNRSVIDVPACPLAMEEINLLLKRTRADRRLMGGLGEGDTVSFRCTKTDGALFWINRASPERALLSETTCLGPVSVPCRAFFQVNIPIADALIRRVRDLFSALRPAAAVDLYCGAGIFALAAGKAGVPAVLGIDQNRGAIRAARKNAGRHGLPGLRFEALAAADGLKFGLAPLSPAGTALIVDPPRAGLEKEVIAVIASHKPGTLIYISCAPDTLARDAARLADAGYRLENTQIFDMFPRTPYFESLTLFTLRPDE